MVRPEDILRDAEKGKYNKDTESFLKSPEFMRIVTEVGLSIAGGIAGVALAPVTGGGSLVAAGALAARTARLVRPLLNISANTMQKIGFAASGAGLGGAAGAGIAQTFDPRESIVREVARGAATGAFGEVLGFGLAGGLAKVFNRTANGVVDGIQGAEITLNNLTRDKQFFGALKKIKQGEEISQSTIESLIKGVDSKFSAKRIPGITDEQASILRDPKRAQELIRRIDNRDPIFFDTVQKAAITPGFITRNNTTNFISNVGRSAIIGSGAMRTAEQSGKMATLNGIDAMTDSFLYSIPKLGAPLDEGGNAVGQLIREGIEKSNESFKNIRDGMWKEVSRGLEKFRRPDGTFDPAYDIIIRGPNVPAKMTVSKTLKTGAKELEVSNLDDYVKSARRDNMDVKNDDITKMLGMIDSMGERPDFLRFRRVYTAIGEMRPQGTANQVRQELVARMESMMTNSPLPPSLNNLRKTAAQFTHFGSNVFRDKTLKRILNTQRGQETIYKQIVAAGKESYYNEFFKVIDESKATIGGKKFDIFPNKVEIKNAVRGQFFTDFLKNSRDLKGQYPTLDRAKATKFLNDHEFLLKKDGFLTAQQVDGIREYTKAINIFEGKIKAAGEAGSNPVMFMQLNQAGALSQGLGLFFGGTGAIDPGTMAFFVAGPAAIAKILANPAMSKILVQGLGKGLTIDSTPKLTRYFSQLSSAFVANGVMDANTADAMMSDIKADKERYDRFFKTGVLDGASGEIKPNPEAAPAIPINLSTPGSIVQSQQVPQMPQILPSNLSFGGANQSNLQLAQALNLFNKGGIVDAKKVNQ